MSERFLWGGVAPECAARGAAAFTSSANAIKATDLRTRHDGDVTASDDTFVAFVDHLTEALDDPQARAWDRLHFSRFHFDRLIRGVAGEPPAAFRRRILLERAAYRMVTTRAPLLDIAVEAGYGSHEAFTRAFTRACGPPPPYGTTPATWRPAPGRIRTPAPSDVHFHPPGSLRLPARDKVTAMDLLTRMVEHHIWLTGGMVRRGGRLAAGQLAQPIEVDVDDDRQTIR